MFWMFSEKKKGAQIVFCLNRFSVPTQMCLGESTGNKGMKL